METETNTKDTDKMNDFYTKFDDHIRQKYKPSESINKTISFMIPVLASLISAYGLFIECFLICRVVCLFQKRLLIFDHI